MSVNARDRAFPLETARDWNAQPPHRHGRIVTHLFPTKAQIDTVSGFIFGATLTWVIHVFHLLFHNRCIKCELMQGYIDHERQFKTAKRPHAPGDATVSETVFRDDFVIFVIDRNE